MAIEEQFIIKFRAKMNSALTSFGKIDKASDKTTKVIQANNKKINKSFGNMKSLIGGLAIGAALKSSIDGIREFSKASSELATLGFDTTEMDKFENAAKGMASAFGTDAKQQVEAFYQAVSAGATTFADAQAVLQAANKLALGGVTDITTATDGLTTVMNAYGLDASATGKISDTFFATMKAGKTTVGEIAASIGKVAPIANAMGLSFEETAAALAHITKSGVNTKEATTGLKAAFSNIIKPTKEAAKIAEELGISFDSQSVGAEGLIPFIQKVAKATGGNIDMMSKLFGSVEAVNSVMILAKDDGAGFASTLDDINNSTGATDTAVEKVKDSLDFKLNKSTAEIKNLGLELGKSMVPILEKLMPHLDNLVSGFAKLVAQNPGLATAAVEIGAVAGALKLLGFGGAIPKILSGLGGGLKKIIGFVAARLAPLGVSVLSGPVGWVALGVVAAGGLAYAFWPEIKAFFTDMWDSLKSWFSSIDLSSVWKYLTPIGLGITLWENLKAPLAEMWQNMKAWFASIDFSSLWAGFADSLPSLPSWLGGDGEDNRKTGSKKPRRKASGGMVRGPGTGTSDSIPALLSNGEYIINAKSTKALGLGTLNKLNKYANGGLVGGNYNIGDMEEIFSIADMFGQIEDMDIFDDLESLIGTLTRDDVVTAFKDAGYSIEGVAVASKNASEGVSSFKNSLNDNFGEGTFNRFKDDVQHNLAEAFQTGDFKSAIKGIFRNLASMFANKAAEQLTSSLFGGSSGGGGIGSFIGSMFGFSEGGIVPRPGQRPQYFSKGGLAKGTDIIPAMLTPGEMVLTKDQQAGMGSVTIHQTINAPLGVDAGTVEFIKNSTIEVLQSENRLVAGSAQNGTRESAPVFK